MNFVYVFVVGAFLISEGIMILSSLFHYLYAAGSLMAKIGKTREGKTRPFVSVLIPVFNEKEVARHAIEACLEFDYPKDKYEIIVIDDSTDGITPVVVAEYPVVHLRRSKRQGFKAGALNYGVKRAKGEILVVFDADFLPPVNYLKKMISYFEEPRIAIAQSRWKYRNENDTLISKCASMMNDAFYESVMKFRHLTGTVIFSGSAGAIRKKALAEAGGFREGALAEDLDVTLRLLAKGWKSAYAYDVVCKGEAPTNFMAFFRQQVRWAFGTTEAFLKNGGSVIGSKYLRLVQKAEMFFSSAGYFVSPFLVVLLITGTINIFTKWVNPNMWIWIIITFFGLGYFMELTVGALSSRKTWNIAYIFLVFFVLVLLNFPIAGGVLTALFGKKMEFHVTPKGI